MVGLWLAWRVMDQLAFTKGQRITALLPLVLLPGLIWQAQDARYYAALGAVYMAALWFGIAGRPLGLLACLGLLPYLHPIGPVYALGALVVAWICGLGFVRGVRTGALAFLSWVPRLFQIASNQKLTGLGPSSAIQSGGTEFWLRSLTPGYVVNQTGQAFAVNTLSPVAAALLFLMLVFVLAVGASRLKERAVHVSLTAVLVPVITLLLTTVIQPVYFYRPVQPLLVPFCLLAGLVLAPRPAWISKIAPAMGAVLLLVELMNWNPAARGGYLDQGAAAISRNWRLGDHIAYASLTVAMPFQYYLPGRESCLIPDNGMGEMPAAISPLPDCRDYAAAGTWLVWPRDPTLAPSLASALAEKTGDTIPVWRSDAAWQFAPIEIYYIP